MDPIVGRGQYTYKVDESWAQVPEWLELKPAAVSVDSEDRVYCFNRNDAHPVVIFDPDGNFVASWGERLFRFPHSIRIVQEQDGWHVDYELKDPGRKGGGPHYVIDLLTGAILFKRYDQ